MLAASTEVLKQTLDLLLADWRERINTAYARRDASSDPIDVSRYQREIDRLLQTINAFEQQIKNLKE